MNDSARANFPREARLTKPRHFTAVLRAGRRYGRKLVLVVGANGLGLARLGMVVSKRNVRHAVTRNRVKRLIRENFRRHRAELQGHDMVVLVGKGVGELDHISLWRALEELWPFVDGQRAT